MLRIVHPAREGQGTRPSKGRRSPVLSLTPEEAKHLRTATRNAARAYGGVEVLASASGIPLKTLYNVTSAKGRRPSAVVALRVAKAAGMSVEAVLSGQLSATGRCAACGARIGERRAS